MGRRHTTRRALLLGLFAAKLWGCGAQDEGMFAGDGWENASDAGIGEGEYDAAMSDAATTSECWSNQDCAEGYTCFAGSCVFQGQLPDTGVLPDSALPPEVEDEAQVLSRPAVGERHVWVTNPSTDSVIRIHAETLAVTAVEVGDEPSEVRTVPGEDRAVVLCRGSDELAVVDAEGALDLVRLPLHGNALTLSPDGRFALVWLDLAQLRAGEDASSVQDLALLDLADLSVRTVAIGYRPSRVQFSEDGARALVVTEDGLSVVSLADDEAAAPLVPVAPSVFSLEDREVVVSPDGAFAASRGPGEPGITVVAVGDAVPHFIDLDAQPTDLDLLPDGRTALVMLRDARRLALVNLETAATSPEGIETVDFAGHTYGSAAVGATRAVLFTTTGAVDRPGELGLLDLEARRLIHRPLRKSVAAVTLSPDGSTGVVRLGKAPGAASVGQDEATFLARSYGYALVQLSTGFTKLELTLADPQGLTFSDDSAAAFALFSGPGVAEVAHITLKTFDVRRYPLSSPPEVVGVVEAVERAFVTQAHPVGRVSFIRLEDADGGRVETVSGYALNGRIE